MFWTRKTRADGHCYACAAEGTCDCRVCEEKRVLAAPIVAQDVAQAQPSSATDR
jgi:hypothetical protein